MRSACAGAQASSAATAPVMRLAMDARMSRSSVREGGGVEETTQPAHRVGTGDRAATAVEDAGIAHPVRGDAVVGTDIGHAHDSLKLDQLVALVQAHLLLAGHADGAVAQVLDHGHGDAA